MAIITMQYGVNVGAMPLPIRAAGIIPAMHRAGWAPAAAAPQHKRRNAIPASVKRGTS
ncbi:hypothetical protein [Mycolicibacterium diernhoferi]|uniref:hypothetical protein n=1 Tax=Mycolicibacterium diernhoferi TaxID=1801 RepID=UPI0013F5A930|nr:hypothetical protein [Mycolicibacterium diernhoferi]QYL24263.1 hypothetical protein K0O62_08360 [Mycolicibacterium diernhoferi]